MTAAVPAPAAPVTRLWRGRTFTSTFRPAPHWSRFIQRHAGIRCRWRALWTIGHGPCAGQWACVPLDGHARGLAWAPDSELVDRVEPLRR